MNSRSHATLSDVYASKTPLSASVIRNDAVERESTVFPGSFNPLHAGHRAIVALATEKLARPVLFELSVFNVDKSALEPTELERRLSQDFGPNGVVVTNCATFEDKAGLFPGATFLVGADTIERISDPKYYEHRASRRDDAIQKIARLGCRFLVFARKSGNKVTCEANLTLATVLGDICSFVDPSEFLMDISSTDLRNNGRDSNEG